MTPHGVSAWHQVPTEQVGRLLEVNLTSGLTDTIAADRLRQHGPNRLTAARRLSPLRRFLRQFAEPLMYILLVAGGVTSILGEHVDAFVIFGVVLVNGIVGFLQESKAEKSIEALSRMVRTEATVRRGGQRRRVDSEVLVPGDVVLLQAGDRVPADLRLFHVRNLHVDESPLTGESLPVAKHPNALAVDTLLAERRNLAFAGTLVTHGQAEGVVWATGDSTETGRIARLMNEAVDLSTPLTRKIAHFSTVIVWVILTLSVLTFALGVFRGARPVEMFMASVALAVGAIPEGLPAAVTITLAIGVSRMARRRAIIRKLPAVEALGSTTVICSDKTGTLTENQMTVQELYAGGRSFAVTGAGYSPVGQIMEGDRPLQVADHAAVRETLLAGLLNNDSQVKQEDGRWVVEGDPTEAALLVVAQKGGLIAADQLGAHPRLDVIPFESENQYMATLHRRADGQPRVIYKKGSVERLLERCDHALAPEGTRAPLEAQSVHAAAERMASRGLRVLAFARRDVGHDQQELRQEHVQAGLTFLGLQGMMDPPRAEAVQAVARCQEAGIRVKMITGDHALTARSIARQLGLGGDRELEALTGRDLERISAEDFPTVAERAAVFARVAPEQKLKLVRALQSRGHVVAMTGDGVNDAPALKQADIGVAMGITGTDVAKSAADMILTDDNFASIEAAVEEGRGVFDNLTKFIVWTLPTNAAEALVLLAGIVLGTALPALPSQFLWVNMTTSLFLGLMLAFEPKERGLMKRRPRDPAQPILTFPLIMRTGLVTLLTMAAAFGAFLWEQEVRGKNLAEARTTVVAVIVVVESFYLLNCRSLLHSIFHVGLFSNRLVFAGIATMWAAQWLFTHTPVMNRLFHTAPMDLASWAYAFGVGLAAYVAVEIEKWIRVRMGEERSLDASR